MKKRFLGRLSATALVVTVFFAVVAALQLTFFRHETQAVLIKQLASDATEINRDVGAAMTITTSCGKSRRAASSSSVAAARCGRRIAFESSKRNS